MLNKLFSVEVCDNGWVVTYHLTAMPHSKVYEDWDEMVADLREFAFYEDFGSVRMRKK